MDNASDEEPPAPNPFSADVEIADSSRYGQPIEPIKALKHITRPGVKSITSRKL